MRANAIRRSAPCRSARRSWRGSSASASVGGVEVDFRDGFKNRRSPEYLIIHGLPPEAGNETHENWVNRIHPEDREQTLKHFLDALAGESEEYTAEYRIIRPNDGQVRWINVVAEIERDAEAARCG